MSNSVSRFSSRVENYAKFRPGYPAEIIPFLQKQCGLTEESVVADIGSGTGLLTELFLRNGNRVFGVEPNEAMRLAGENYLKSFERFTSVNGTAEETTLATQSVDLITAGQAFHWFHPANAREEFLRILKPNGCVVIIWNERRLGSTPFLQEYEQLLLTFGTDYQEVRHENVAERVADFFAPNEVQVTQFDNEQLFDLEGLRGRLMSASYTPEPDHPNFQPMMTALQHLFQRHELNGRVAIEYDTTVRYGRLSAVQPQ